jgi:FAD/FMN-containing dehydrogenase
MVKTHLINIFGSKNVFDDPETLEHYSKDHSFVPARKPMYVVVAETQLQIQKLAVLANAERIPIVPRSSKQGFYGLTIPEEGGVVLDLSNLKQIFEVDPRNRRTRIQPGVTYSELQKELEPYELMALNPLFPHHSKSVLSSHLERDPMLIPKFEYADPLIVLEAVLPNGEIFRTGSTFTTYAPNEQISDLKGPWGPGLDFYRLFQGAQGTIGIVTWVSIKIEHLPKKQKFFYL